METGEQPIMADNDYRALLTKREKEILLGEADDVSEKYYYRVVTRVRQKIEKLVEEDMAVLETHDSLADELREGICEDQETNDDE